MPPLPFQLLLISVAVLLPFFVLSLIFGRWIVVQLTLKYLLKRRLAWLAVMAVAACVWLVLVVYSVMGGWLRMFEDTYKSMSGDLVVWRPGFDAQGFAGYEEIIRRVQELPEVSKAIPIIRTFGIFSVKSYQHYVMVVGLPTDVDGNIDTAGVVQFERSLWLQNKDSKVQRWVPERQPSFKLWPMIEYAAMAPTVKNAGELPGAIVGGGVVGILRDEKTNIPDWNRKFAVSSIMPAPITLIKITVAPPDRLQGGATSIPQSAKYYWIVDGSRTQLPTHDESIYVSFDTLQQQMELNAKPPSTRIDADGNDILGPDGKPELIEHPGRTTEIQIALKDPSRINEMKPKIQAIVDDVTGGGRATFAGPIRVQTWREVQEDMIGAIQNEIRLTTTLFAFISLVAVFMIFAIFYMIVMEKTRDIGIIKSVGATAWSIASIFLAYGAIIGVVGGGVGVLAGWLTVRYINEIHTKLGDWFGWQIWSAKTYAFDLIPNRVDGTAAVVVLYVAIVAAVVGAIVPAIKAALARPVESLRFE
ncbi:MAG: FtsX-like permease family protein [Tepidisphaeraceae bacterium]